MCFMIYFSSTLIYKPRQIPIRVDNQLRYLRVGAEREPRIIELPLELIRSILGHNQLYPPTKNPTCTLCPNRFIAQGVKTYTYNQSAIRNPQTLQEKCNSQ